MRFGLLSFAATLALISFGDVRAEGLLLEPPDQIVAEGQLLEIQLSYKGGSAAVGLGVRLHFNSEQLSFQELSWVLQRDLIAFQPPVPDEENLDGDPATDRFILMAWADVANDGWLLTESERLAVVSFMAHGKNQTRVNVTTTDSSFSLSLDDTVATVRF